MNAGMKGVEYFFRGSGPTVWTAASSVGIRSRCRSIDPKFYGCKGFKVGTKHRGPLLIFQSGTIALPFVMDCPKTRHSLTDFMCTNFYRAKLIINNSHARIFISIKFYLHLRYPFQFQDFSLFFWWTKLQLHAQHKPRYLTKFLNISMLPCVYFRALINAAVTQFRTIFPKWSLN